ncbi:hypothetical protein BP6252_00423 [Coleophoma cylindrospora]|uniref:NAD-dependent epimerase/dehydratase domain-containing protein n=1 Tax=Coleophoma cylindrospora TaxID=1849047 RepID=A0A3D8SQE1_9HELO|nr:hypothetical protein BP6252_00423 [Coleophoma cylindrospora]
MAPAIPEGSLVLVTGVNGYIASHVADQILEAGYKVRGTSRTLEKGNAVKAALEKKHGAGKVEIVVVEDMEKEGAFDEAVKGVSGVVHVASNMSFDCDPYKVIPGVIAGVNNVLTSAAKESGVQRFVYTSSSTAATRPKRNQKFTITKDSWNTEDIETAWKPAPYDPSRAMAVYGASKAQGEQELWKFMAEKKPGFVANAVLPNANFGPLTFPTQFGSTTTWVFSVYDGNLDPVRHVAPQYFVDVRDTARLHVAGLINPDVQNERIFAFTEPFNFSDVMQIIKEIEPDHKLPEETLTNDRDLSEVAEIPRAIELLKEFGRDGFIPLKQSIIDALASRK